MNPVPHSLIIGGTRGTGRALVRLWAAQGQRVSVLARRLPPLGQDEELTESDVRFYTADLVSPDLEMVLQSIVAERGALQNLVFFQRFRGEGDVWDGEMQVALNATRRTIETLVGHFNLDGGTIVLVSSVAATFIAQEQPVGYHVAKAGLVQMARYYALTLGSRAIRINCVSPSVILKDEAREFHAAHPEISHLYSTVTPLGRMATPEDVADVIGCLCSAQMAFVTGQNIVVDGGMSLHAHASLANVLKSP